jgi:hypothetical protein
MWVPPAALEDAIDDRLREILVVEYAAQASRGSAHRLWSPGRSTLAAKSWPCGHALPLSQLDTDI